MSLNENSQIPESEIDFLLTNQLLIAWAGESGEHQRLGWWRTDLTSEYGGQDLFRRLLPHSWRWAVIQGAREAARKRDAEVRRQESDPDRILSLFFMGHEIDERIDERLQNLKRSGRPPFEALPKLCEFLGREWNREWFNDWVQGHGAGNYTTTSVGRRIKGNVPVSLELRVRGIVAAFSPLTDEYPLSHYRRTA